MTFPRSCRESVQSLSSTPNHLIWAHFSFLTSCYVLNLYLALKFIVVLFDLLHVRWPSLFNFAFADIKMNLYSLRTCQLMAEWKRAKRKRVSQPYSKGYKVKFKFKYSGRKSTKKTLNSNFQDSGKCSGSKILLGDFG